ncbi:CidA/LrgA family protein [Loktanella sp. SALINAS62]|uniref:CidA/LrgA family protein n=1 Tax=Loktanella sp. SALINAS62 TaxID=2706124 RepID=UPI001B8AA856|nr:CidA/LrgA family protein [Loktanella sp. SALINAS62]MBS1300976.1 CidA/LrgA family protein [Loktanella sp. SALINAS62]
MIQHLTILLAFQLLGEAISRAAGLPLPGPVLGMALLFLALLGVPRLAAIASTAQGLLAHLSLLFVPAGVGVVGQLDRLGNDGVGLALAILGSTAIAIIAGVYTFLAVARVLDR